MKGTPTPSQRTTCNYQSAFRQNSDEITKKKILYMCETECIQVSKANNYITKEMVQDLDKTMQRKFVN